MGGLDLAVAVWMKISGYAERGCLQELYKASTSVKK